MSDTITGAPSLGGGTDQYIVLCGQIVGSRADGFQTVYRWDGEIHADRKAAIAAGWKARSNDDFNIGVIRDGRLVSLDWMDEPLDEPAEVLIEIEEQIDWRDPRDTFEVGQEADGLQQGGDESDFAWLARLRQRFAAPPSEALAQALAAARAETEWRDISTAPKDGTTVVDLFNGYRHIGFYWDVEQRGGGGWSDVRDRRRHRDDRRGVYGATHWMPAPGDPAGIPDRRSTIPCTGVDDGPLGGFSSPTPAQTDTAPGGRADA